MVLTGRIAIAKRSTDGRESLVALMEPGDLFGEMSLFDEEARPASARALERSEVARVPFDVVRKDSKPVPTCCGSVVALFATRLRAVSAALADAMLLDVDRPDRQEALELPATPTSSSCPSPRRNSPVS